MQEKKRYAISRRALALAAAIFATVAATFAQPVALDTLFAETPQAFSQFGYDLAAGSDALARTFLVASEPEGGQCPGQCGRIYAYRFASEGGWLREDSLSPPPGSQHLGDTVAILDNSAAPLAAVRGPGDAVSVRRRSEEMATWDLEATLDGIEKPGSGGAFFGSDLVAHLLPSGEELLFIGAQNGGDDPTGGSREGSAYAFVRPPTEPPGPDAWIMEARILAPDGEEGDQFGTSVALLSTPGLTGGHPGDALVIIGANLHPRTSGQDGAVYAYVRSGATGMWAFEAKFTPADLQDFDRFGTAVALLPLPGGLPGEALAVVGSPDDDDLAVRSGAAYIFRRAYAAVDDTFRWVEETKLLPSGARVALQFGGAVAASADTLNSGTPVMLALIGADPDPGTEGQGHPSEASLFVRSTATGEPVWTRRATYQTGADGFASDWFGHTVAFAPTADGLLALVGAYRSNAALEQGFPSGTEAGAIFIYDASVVVAEEAGLPASQGGVSLSVFPNPARGEVQIRLRLPAPEHIRLALYDVLGREVVVVFEGELLVGLHTHRVALSGLAPGAYLLRVDGAVSSLSQLITVFR